MKQLSEKRKEKFSAKRVAVLGVLLALASVMFIVESLVPPLLPMAPYVKIGLANSVVLLVIILFGAADAFFFVLAKNLLTALAVSFFVLPFNLAGSLCAYLAMAAMYVLLYPKVSLVSVSIAGAIVSNIARTGVAVLLMEAPSLYIQLPFICGLSVLAGIVIGILTTFLVKYLPERLTKLK